jgi:predicted AAA+ superfamily ATPase
MLEEALRLANEWWLSGTISSEKALPYRRSVFKDLKALLGYRQVVVLTGLRRVGKSTLMFQIISDLLKEIDRRHILYFNFDDAIAEPMEILRAYGTLTGVDWKREKCFVFLDEIQKIKCWSSKIKFLYDNLPNIKFVVSGSASLMLEKEAISSLAGRYFMQDVEPLSIKEFAELYLNTQIDSIELYRDEMERLFPLWIKRPFPEIARWTDERRVNEYIREMILDKVLRIDLPDMFRVRTSLLSTLAEIFLCEPGTILNVTALASNLKVHKLALEEHIRFLEFAKIIRVIKNFRPWVRAESRKMKKVYPYTIALSSPYYPVLDKGKVLETLAAMSMGNYWREGTREVDFIKREELLPVEVKAKENVRKEELAHLFYFMKKYGVSRGCVVYTGKSKKELFDAFEIRFLNVLDFLCGEDLKSS